MREGRGERGKRGEEGRMREWERREGEERRGERGKRGEEGRMREGERRKDEIGGRGEKERERREGRWERQLVHYKSRHMYTTLTCLIGAENVTRSNGETCNEKKE